jgi:hypothetical protein
MAANFAVTYCNSTHPDYCNLEDQGSPDCINWVSQILQYGGLGICGNWYHNEPIDPQFQPPPLGWRCLACGQYYTVQWVVPRAIPGFLASAQFSNHGWQVCGPFDYDHINEDRPSALFLMQGDMILIDWHDACDYWEGDDVGHSMWVYSDETDANFNCILTYHSSNTCPYQGWTLRNWLDSWNFACDDFARGSLFVF